jgi:hypothetical protein
MNLKAHAPRTPEDLRRSRSFSSSPALDRSGAKCTSANGCSKLPSCSVWDFYDMYGKCWEFRRPDLGGYEGTWLYAYRLTCVHARIEACYPYMHKRIFGRGSDHWLLNPCTCDLDFHLVNVDSRRAIPAYQVPPEFDGIPGASR